MDVVHSFKNKKTPRTLKLLILNTSTNYESIPKGTLLGTFEPVDEDINEIHTTSCTKLEGQMHQAHSQLRRKKSYKQALWRTSKEGKESPELLPQYPTESNMEMETVMKRQEVNLEEAKDADKWKAKVMSMLESKFISIVSKSSTDVGQTNLHTLDVQVTEGSPVFVKQYTIPLKYRNFIDETKWLEEAGLISRSLSNWSIPAWSCPRNKTQTNQMRFNLEW